MINLTNIQHFSLHDGPGIRTTVFLKGCNLRCPWCANPENIYSEPQKYIRNGVSGTYGKYLSPNEVYKELIMDKQYYEDGGGVTFSGGECLLQQENLKPLWIKLKSNNIHIAVETALFVSNIGLALTYIDLFIVDIKLLNQSDCLTIEKGDIGTYYENIDKLLNSGKPVIFRIPVIGGYTDSKINQKLVLKFLEKISKKNNNIKKIELIKEHNLGLSKYQSLHNEDSKFPIPDYKGVSDTLMEDYKQKIEKVVSAGSYQIPVEICSI